MHQLAEYILGGVDRGRRVAEPDAGGARVVGVIVMLHAAITVGPAWCISSRLHAKVHRFDRRRRDRPEVAAARAAVDRPRLRNADS